ncbi:MAG: UDP-glucose/GDP-mannose dehydrogenase family protein [Deltaproteobacteria bacterium]|nr:UDP-glucose/GDP-mannose dehydrogenase family protein [Deltaproteobacteria bacterium]
MRLAVIGTGYVGLVAGAGFADFGNDVVCCDVDTKKIARLLAGEIPIYEPGLDTLVARSVKHGRLRFSSDIETSIAKAEVVFIAVGTPQSADGSADLSSVVAVAEAIGRSITGFTVVVNKSTVPIGTADRVRETIAARTTHPFAVVSNPEFLKEGDAVNDFMKPDRVIIGTDDERARAVMRHLYAPFVRTNDRLQFMEARSAELTKYAANALLATRISFMNELANLAEKVGADIEHVRRGVGSDPRIGPKFLFPGAGFGGSCFPKDIKALLHAGKVSEIPLDIVDAVDRVNARQKTVLASKIEKHFQGDVAGKTIAVWGLAFKPQTDDIREAPALVLIERLLSLGAKVVAHDPVAMDNVRALHGDKIALAPGMYEALEGADGLALVTEWHEFRTPDFARIKGQLRQPVIFDGRNVWNPGELRSMGFTYYGIGRRS